MERFKKNKKTERHKTFINIKTRIETNVSMEEEKTVIQ